MKKIILLFVFVFLSASTGFAKDIWKTLQYYHYSGPVSLRYQVMYTITVNNDRTGTIKYVWPGEGGKDTTIGFKVSRKMMNRLNVAVKNSQVMTVMPADMLSSQELIGGPTNVLTLTTENTSDYSSSTREYPNFIIDAYSGNIDKLYKAIYNCVPNSVWNSLGVEQ